MIDSSSAYAHGRLGLTAEKQLLEDTHCLREAAVGGPPPLLRPAFLSNYRRSVRRPDLAFCRAPSAPAWKGTAFVHDRGRPVKPSQLAGNRRVMKLLLGADRVATMRQLDRKTAVCSSLALYLLLSCSAAGAANVTIQRNETSGLRSWLSESDGFSIELIQLLPDFIRAIYMSKGFPESEVEDIASYCVFGSVIKNTSSTILEYDVRKWHYKDADGVSHRIKTKSAWLEQWRKAGVTFSWTLLPDKGTFHVGDWQQGFTTIELPRESRFSFTYTWTLDGVEYSDTIEDMSCAPESLPGL